jgi:flagellum-specific peptidoglycan hydrolase FlgJ
MKKLLLIAIFLLVTLTSFTVNSEKPENSVVEINNELTIENIVKYMKELEIKHIDILLAQIHLETGNLKKIKHENNLFGFRINNYLTFETWQDCIFYMKVWQDKHWGNYTNKGGKDYYNFLRQKKYATDIDYIAKLKKITKLYNIYVEE